MAVRNIYFKLGDENDERRNTPSALDNFPDPEIWKRFISGDEAAFAHIYRLYVNRLFNFGRQFSQDSELIKDVIQDLFVRLRKSKSTGKVLSIRSYLFKCFYRDLVKKMEREKLYTSPVQDSFAISLSVEHSLFNEQTDEIKRKHLTEALNRLSTKQRQALLLFYYEGLSYKEISHIFDLKNSKSARKLVYRSIDSLRKIFNHPVLWLYPALATSIVFESFFRR